LFMVIDSGDAETRRRSIQGLERFLAMHFENFTKENSYHTTN